MMIQNIFKAIDIVQSITFPKLKPDCFQKVETHLEVQSERRSDKEIYLLRTVIFCFVFLVFLLFFIWVLS